MRGFDPWEFFVRRLGGNPDRDCLSAQMYLFSDFYVLTTRSGPYKNRDVDFALENIALN